jgi:DNA segregation ATPase FtsK/SpoIIIE, S-DNA-T family
VSNALGVSKLRDQLEAMRNAIADLSAREEKAQQELKVKVTRDQKNRDAALEELAVTLAARTDEAVTAYKQVEQNEKTRFEKRRAIILKAHKTSKKQAIQRIEHVEGSRKYKLQRETLNSQRKRETDIAETERACEAFKRSLGEENENLFRSEAAAKDAFGGYSKFSKALAKAHETAPATANGNEYDLFNELQKLRATADEKIARVKRMFVARFFAYIIAWAVVAAGLFALVPILNYFHIQTLTLEQAGAVAGGLVVLAIVLHIVGANKAAPVVKEICDALGRARNLQAICLQKADERRVQTLAQIESNFQTTTQRIQGEWSETLTEAEGQKEGSGPMVDEKATLVTAHNEAMHRAASERIAREHADAIARIYSDIDARKKEVNDRFGQQEQRHRTVFETEMQVVSLEWKTKLEPIYRDFADAQALSEKLFPQWSRDLVERWNAPGDFAHVARFGAVDLAVDKFVARGNKETRLVLPGPSNLQVPMLLTYPEQGSVLFEGDAGRSQMVASLNNIVLRLLAAAPPGRFSFTIIDPVELGQNFASFMHLADHEEHLINSRIWTQADQIDQRLAELNAHMEKVIQMYLRNEYKTIVEYNEQAGNIAEKYHFLVIADFPHNFSDIAIRRLLSIVTSGARCGVYSLIHWDTRQRVDPAVAEELRKSGAHIVSQPVSRESKATYLLDGKLLPGVVVNLDEPPNAELATDLIHKVGKSSRDSNRVEVPFEHVAPRDGQWWSLDTGDELRVPIGRTGATKFQYLAIGKGTRQHALIAGKTGSGKSTLFHVIITNLAMWCSPEQVEFYLIDFKKGVEFKAYATHQLPHARVVAIESDREFGLSVLQRLDAELKRRGELFREHNVQDLPSYRKASGKAMPRTLLLIDEFQEFFTEDDKIFQAASVLLDRIVRQGRAFGIHVILGSQTLGGAYTVARTTLGQMVIRIALQCNEADAYLIMDDSNPAPRMLTRPGEGIYNDSAGAIEANSPFQAVWLSDEQRDVYLDRVHQQADQSGKRFATPLVYEGDAPADVRENTAFQQLLQTPPTKKPELAHMWLGAPNSIKGPTEAVFRRQSGNNLLIVGQREEAVLSIVSTGLLSLSAQFPNDGARFLILDSSPPDSPQAELLNRVIASAPQQVTRLMPHELADVFTKLVAEMRSRDESPNPADAPSTFVFIRDIQRFGKLRYEEDFSFSSSEETAASPAVLLNQLINEGPSLGIHIIVTCDTYNNVNRFLSRKAFSEFEMRVLFQMSASDSASLIDNPKAGSLGLHRALFYNEQEGQLETFRPYALPPLDWVDDVKNSLAVRP